MDWLIVVLAIGGAVLLAEGALVLLTIRWRDRRAGPRAIAVYALLSVTVNLVAVAVFFNRGNYLLSLVFVVVTIGVIRGGWRLFRRAKARTAALSLPPSSVSP